MGVVGDSDPLTQLTPMGGILCKKLYLLLHPDLSTEEETGSNCSAAAAKTRRWGLTSGAAWMVVSVRKRLSPKDDGNRCQGGGRLVSARCRE
jgi:hypothetical protein